MVGAMIEKEGVVGHSTKESERLSIQHRWQRVYLGGGGDFFFFRVVCFSPNNPNLGPHDAA